MKSLILKAVTLGMLGALALATSSSMAASAATGASINSISAPTSPAVTPSTFATSISASASTLCTSDSAAASGPANSCPLDDRTDGFAAIAQIIHSMQQSPDGAVQLGGDGVLRSYNSNGAVIDHRKLSNAQIQAWLADFPAGIYTPEQTAELNATMYNVNGHDVTDPNQILNPPSKFVPAHLRSSVDARSPHKPLNPITGQPNVEDCYTFSCTTSTYCAYLATCVSCFFWNAAGGFCI